MTEVHPVPLLSLARELARSRSFNELLIALQTHVVATLGYSTVWLGVKDQEESTSLRIIDMAGAQRELIYDQYMTIPLEGDAMIAEIFAGQHIVVVEDARVDPRTNKEIVQALGNRTIINVPLAMLDKPFGALGMGTFHDEGVRAPTPAMLDQMLAIANLVSVAASRLRLEERERKIDRERRVFEGRVARMQRMDSIGVLAGGVAHDFNNLLTVVIAASSLARTADTLADARNELAAIEEAAARGQELTRQLLAMSRKQPLALVQLDPNAAITELLPLLRRVIPQNIQIDAITPNLQALIEGDRTQIDQVLMNLCLNARDAMPDGGRLTIETEVVAVNGPFREMHPWAKVGRYILITVSDTGHGIDPANLERIFEPFFTTKTERGTGLGLSVAHGIIGQHGGMLHCYSEVGIGTTFKIYLPVTMRAAESVGRKVQGQVSGGQERLLIGEDDEAVRRVMRRILERAGYDVTLVPDGDAVLLALKNHSYDLLILDVVMPGPRCSEVIERARNLRPSLRMLLASGYTADVNVSALLRDANAPLLAKPYDPDQLLRAIRSELDREV